MVKRKLNLKKAAILISTSAALMFSGCGQKNVVNADTLPEKKVVTTEAEETQVKAASTESVKVMNEDELFDDLLSAADGFDEDKDYENILKREEKKEEQTETEAVTEEVKEEQTEEVKEEPVTEEVKEEPKKETEKDENPYIQYDSEGDAFVVVDENGNFVENPEAPEKYAVEEETEKVEEAAVEQAAAPAEVSEEAIAYVKEYFTNSDNSLVDYINNGDFEGAVLGLKDTIITGLDFLFFDGKIGEYTRKQIDNDTIIFVMNELNNNISIAKDLQSDCLDDLGAKYLQAKDYLTPEMVEKLDDIAKDIISKLPEEENSLSNDQVLTKK